MIARLEAIAAEFPPIDRRPAATPSSFLPLKAAAAHGFDHRVVDRVGPIVVWGDVGH
jgi:hypothetical protein